MNTEDKIKALTDFKGWSEESLRKDFELRYKDTIQKFTDKAKEFEDKAGMSYWLEEYYEYSNKADGYYKLIEDRFKGYIDNKYQEEIKQPKPKTGWVNENKIISLSDLDYK